MKLYCPSCQVLCEAVCPLCGGRKLRLPRGNDPAFLCNADLNQALPIEAL